MELCLYEKMKESYPKSFYSMKVSFFFFTSLNFFISHQKANSHYSISLLREREREIPFPCWERERERWTNKFIPMSHFWWHDPNIEEHCTLVAAALIPSNISMCCPMSSLRTFRRVVPESGVMSKPIRSDIRFQWRARIPLLHITPMTGMLSYNKANIILSNYFKKF